MKRLLRDFFERDTLFVAKDLIGRELCFKNNRGFITETEAYIGQDDPACHAARGITKRNAVMFGKAGFSYVYLIYGMYNCLNIVTEKEGFPAAVLIRGIWDKENNKLYDGPGKLCKNFGINRDYNNIDLITANDFLISDKKIILPFEATPRIGIKVGTDKLWRFVVKNLPKS